MPSTRDPLQYKKYIKAKSKEMGKDIHANGKEKISGVSILTSDKIDFKTKDTT